VDGVGAVARVEPAQECAHAGLDRFCGDAAAGRYCGVRESLGNKPERLSLDRRQPIRLHAARAAHPNPALDNCPLRDSLHLRDLLIREAERASDESPRLQVGRAPQDRRNLDPQE